MRQIWQGGNNRNHAADSALSTGRFYDQIKAVFYDL
jgi:hypothetical protein